jgi:hypothetical protein
MRDRPPSAVMPLYMVDKVALSRTGEGAMWLHAVPLQSRAGGFMGRMMTGCSPRQELLRFNPLLTTHHSNNLGLNKDANGVIVWSRLLVDWNRRRLVREIKKGRAIIVPRNRCWPHLPGTSRCCEGKQGREERVSNQLLPAILRKLSSGK